MLDGQDEFSAAIFFRVTNLQKSF